MKRFKVTFGDVISCRRLYSVVIHGEDADDARDRADGLDFDSIVSCGLAKPESEEQVDAEAPWAVESVKLLGPSPDAGVQVKLAKYRELADFLSNWAEEHNRVFRRLLAEKLAEIAALDPEE